mgnify:CR=1 FL=1
MDNKYAISTSQEPNIIKISGKEAQEILRISPDGRIFWKQREIETDDEFRAAILELKTSLPVLALSKVRRTNRLDRSVSVSWFIHRCKSAKESR